MHGHVLSYISTVFAVYNRVKTNLESYLQYLFSGIFLNKILNNVYVKTTYTVLDLYHISAFISRLMLIILY